MNTKGIDRQIESLNKALIIRLQRDGHSNPKIGSAEMQKAIKLITTDEQESQKSEAL